MHELNAKKHGDEKLSTDTEHERKILNRRNVNERSNAPVCATDAKRLKDLNKRKEKGTPLSKNTDREHKSL
jgi:hypothetical protein